MKAAVQAIEPVLDTFLSTTLPLQREAPVLTQKRTPPRGKERVGMLFEATFDEDRSFLQMEFIYRPTWENPNSPLKHVSSFGILRDQFRSFFGTAEDFTSLCLENSALGHCPERRISDLPVDGINSPHPSDNSSDTFWDAYECQGRKRSNSTYNQSDGPSAVRRRIR
jgi:hypothetical protein